MDSDVSARFTEYEAALSRLEKSLCDAKAANKDASDTLLAGVETGTFVRFLVFNLSRVSENSGEAQAAAGRPSAIYSRAAFDRGWAQFQPQARAQSS